MKRTQQAIGNVLLASTALGGAGVAIERERALDAYTIQALAGAEDPKTEFAARRTLETIKATQPTYVAVLNANAQAASDPENADKRKAAEDAQREMLGLISNAYQGRDFRPQVKTMEAQVEALRKALGIQHPIQTSVLPTAHIQAKAIYEPAASPIYKVVTSLGALDVLSPRELAFVHAHEAAHIAKDYMDSSGQPKTPDFTHITKDRHLARAPIANLQQEIKHALATELNADKNAVMQTCDPQAATSALASSHALSQNMTPNDFRLLLEDRLRITPGNLASYLYDAAMKRPVSIIITKDGKQFVESPHPHWKDRVAAVIKTAEEHCPTR